MKDFVDPADPAAVEAVLAKALTALGPDGLLTPLDGLPGLQVEPGRARGVFRQQIPGWVAVADRRLVLTADGATLEHVVGGVVLARDAVGRAALPGALAALICRSVADSGATDEASVRLTALRDAVSVS